MNHLNFWLNSNVQEEKVVQQTNKKRQSEEITEKNRNTRMRLDAVEERVFPQLPGRAVENMFLGRVERVRIIQNFDNISVEKIG